MVPANMVPCEIGISGGIILLGIGVVATIAQLLMTEGYRHVSVTVGSVLGMLVPVLNFVVGMLFFGEKMSSAAVIGTAMVIVSCIVVSIEWGGRSPAVESSR